MYHYLVCVYILPFIHGQFLPLLSYVKLFCICGSVFNPLTSPWSIIWIFSCILLRHGLLIRFQLGPPSSSSAFLSPTGSMFVLLFSGSAHPGTTSGSTLASPWSHPPPAPPYSPLPALLWLF